MGRKQETWTWRTRKKCFTIIIFKPLNRFISFYLVLGLLFAYFFLSSFYALFLSILFSYFTCSQNVLAIGDATWTNFGYPRWELVLCLLFGWFVAFLCLSKGIKSAGKTLYFIVIFPYVILTVLLVSSFFFH